MDKQVVNVIAESSVIYGPDKDLENELDLDPDPDLVKLFDLDPEFTSMNPEKLSMGDDDRTLKGSIDLPPTSNSSSGSSDKDGRRARMKSKIKTKVQGPIVSHGQSGLDSHQQPSPQPHRPSPTALSRLEAMVVRYIKWLHILIQCRQLLCRNPAAATAALSGSDHSLSAATVSGTLAGAVHAAIKSYSPTISITDSTIPGSLDRRPSDFLAAGNISTGNLGGSSTPTKAPATTATTTSTTAMAVGPDAGGLSARLAGGLLPGSSLASSPSTQTNSIVSSASSSTSSLSSMSSSPAVATAAMLSQPATGTASGRVIGTRTLLTATAALEAAAQTNQQQQQQQHNHLLGSMAGGSHPFMNEMNEMISTHLDPLSNSVSEVIRKGSAKIKKSVVDPLAANPLFKSVSNASSSLTVSLGGGGDRDSRVGGGSSAVSSAASSMRSVKSRSSALPVNMERTASATSSVSNSAASVIVGGNDDPDGEAAGRAAEDAEGNNEADTEKEAAAVVETVSILDPNHPAHQSDDQVIKILETLGLMATPTVEIAVEAPTSSSRTASIISS